MTRLALACVLVPALAATAHADTANPFGVVTAATMSATSQLDAQHGAAAAIGGPGWCAKKGDGVGETLTITLAAPFPAEQLAIEPGMWIGDKPSKAWNRPTGLTVAVDGGAPTPLTFDHDGRARLPLGKTVSKVEIAFSKVKKGKKKASCLTRVSFTGKDDAWVAVVSDPRTTAGLAADAAALGKALTSCTADAVGATVVFPIDHTLSTFGVEPEVPDETTTYKTAADFVKAHCDSPPWIGSPDSAGEPTDGYCAASAVDVVTCSSNPQDGYASWTLAWQGGHWKLTSIDVSENGGE